MAVEERWQRGFAFLALDAEQIGALLGERVLEVASLSGGLRNTNYRLRLAGQAEPVVLRLYTAEAEACRREAALLRLVDGRVPVPHVLRSDPDASPPWMLQTFVPGERLDHVLQAASPARVEALCYSAGRHLAAVHAFTFPWAGFFDGQLQMLEPLGPAYGWSAMLEDWLAGERVPARLGAELSQRLLAFVRANGWREEQLVVSPPSLLHADYKPWNLLASDDQVTAVLDWEFAFAGTPLNDLGIFLRYRARERPEYTRGFVAGYRDGGGRLPDDWPRLSQLIDLISLCSFLDREQDDPTRTRDVQQLIAATLELDG
jgi:aminoglycoside phosphotransferase (APT) family kinase protein